MKLFATEITSLQSTGSPTQGDKLGRNKQTKKP